MTIRRLFVCLVAVLIIFALISSAAFIVLEADHECLKDSCLICDRIAACLQMLRTGIAVLVLVLLFRFAYTLLHLIPHISAAVVSPSTPIALKVKLSD